MLVSIYIQKDDNAMERKEKIYNTLMTAAKKGFTSLFSQHHEHFYYCALIMMEIATPCIGAISEESLEQVLNDNYSDRKDRNEIRTAIKWSYADSPYIGFGFEEYFQEVDKLFNNDIWSEKLACEEYEQRVNDWISIMVDVMRELDKKGVFSSNVDRSNLFINAELQPPDSSTNLDNARALNDDAIFSKWFEDNKDEYDFDE